MNKLLLLFSLTLSIPVLPLRRFLEHGNCSGFTLRKDGLPTERERLPPSIYSVGSFKSVWAVSAETINFLQWWAFFIGTKYIWSGFRKGHSIITALLGIRDDIRAMKRGEVSLMVFADYSEAFDTVCFKTVLTNLQDVRFRFFKRISYLDGPLPLWSLPVRSDRQDLVYRDDTTFFVHSKTNDLANGVVKLNDAIWRLGNYSSESNFALNEAKTKWMLVSNRQMSRA